MNNVQPRKCGYPSKAIKENAVKSEKFRDTYDILRLLLVLKHAKRYERTDAKKDNSLCRSLREPLKVNERVLALAELLNKNDTSKHFYKSTTDNVSFFNCEEIFAVRKILKTSEDNYLY